MRTQYLFKILLISIMLFFVSCMKSKNEDNPTQPKELHGKWELYKSNGQSFFTNYIEYNFSGNGTGVVYKKKGEANKEKINWAVDTRDNQKVLVISLNDKPANDNLLVSSYEIEDNFLIIGENEAIFLNVKK